MNDLSLNLDIPGYNFIIKPSPSIVGGVAMYISNNCYFKIIDKYNLGLPAVEDLWIELTVDKKKRIIGIIYRHPKYAKVEEFLLTFDKTLKIISSDNKLCYILLLGDLNINTYDTSNKVSKNFVNLTRSNAFHSLISMATRITPSSVSTIDHILSNKSNFKVKPTVFQCSISDHYAIFYAISKLASTTSKTVSCNYFNLQQFDREKFCSELRTSSENNL